MAFHREIDPTDLSDNEEWFLLHFIKPWNMEIPTEFTHQAYDK